MTLVGSKTYVGFGFGAIQAGLFLYEAFHSGQFGRLVVAETVQEKVARLRRAQGFYNLNIAHADRVETVAIGPVEILNPGRSSERAQLVAALAAAQEIGTAIPSVDYYVSRGPASVHSILADCVRIKLHDRGPRAVVYTAENHTQAAQLLESAVLGALSSPDRERLGTVICFVNTVIGKMSGVAPAVGGLAPITPGDSSAFLVEAFNRILISQIRFTSGETASEFHRGIQAFQEKIDLQPFEEAKLYGHNAIHAMAAYVGRLLGVERVAELAQKPGVMPFLRDAFVEECGAGLLAKHRNVDPLFTPAGFQAYADDLLQRMTNPYLQDTVARVGRDPARKLGWNDRLIGAMRLALVAGVTPRRLAFGAAAAVHAWQPDAMAKPEALRDALLAHWHSEGVDEDAAAPLLALVLDANQAVQRWQNLGCPDLSRFFNKG